MERQNDSHLVGVTGHNHFIPVRTLNVLNEYRKVLLEHP